MTLQSSPYPRAPRWLQAIKSGHLRAVAKEMEADALGDWPGVEEWRETLLGWAQELHARHQWLAQNENRGRNQWSREAVS